MRAAGGSIYKALGSEARPGRATEDPLTYELQERALPSWCWSGDRNSHGPRVRLTGAYISSDAEGAGRGQLCWSSR